MIKPTDRELTNLEHGERAKIALQAYAAVRGETFEVTIEAISDLVADLLHLADKLDESKDGAERVQFLADLHFDAEIMEENDEQEGRNQ